ncbi:MAG: abortive infection protein [Chitinophagaceae bacterium]|nr:MAG: abortive infection protein [Chitinophagaceae bacterium]
MKKVIGYIKEFAREADKITLLIASVFIAGMVWLNYGAGLEDYLVHNSGLIFPAFTGRLILFIITFGIPYLIIFVRKRSLRFSWPFFICLVAGPVLFALKAGMDLDWNISKNYSWNSYWNDILYWPTRTLVMVVLLILCWTLFDRDKSRYGLQAKGLEWKPYWLMLLFMVPLIAAASTQADFLHTYPKLKNILPLPSGAEPGWYYKILYELAYGSDFFSIELFFRGFLVIGISRWAGKEAIIPMACFYCSIHFGKQLGECISSYFGGLLLGIVSYHTRSIFGGLMVHLGIAWLMELGAVLASGG